MSNGSGYAIAQVLVPVSETACGAVSGSGLNAGLLKEACSFAEELDNVGVWGHEQSSKRVSSAPAQATDRSAHGEVVKAAMLQSRPLRTDPPPSQEFEVRPLGDASIQRPRSAKTGARSLCPARCTVP